MATEPSKQVGFPVLAAISAAMLSITLYLIFGLAPVELQMGVVQKIFYFHVPSAYAMYVGFTASAVGSTMYLWKRRDAWDAIAVAGAEVGTVFCFIVLITGPLWAYKAWGVWWVWDPRLTTTMLVGMLFAAYLALRGFGAAGEVEKRFASGLAIVGLFILPIIHYSVQRWRGQHPTVITGKGGGLDPDMRVTLLVSFATFTFVVATLLWLRFRVERNAQRVLELELDARERGLLEDSW
ncbi:MAG: cytochrome c biogenesis protein CcsA [Polyangiales bacterium]|nr:cytochrome c biogenesis protein CcsA [Myxococcales bacterium]